MSASTRCPLPAGEEVLLSTFDGKLLSAKARGVKVRSIQFLCVMPQAHLVSDMDRDSAHDGRLVVPETIHVNVPHA